MHDLAISEKQGKQSTGIKVGVVILYLLICNLVCASLCLHGTVLCHSGISYRRMKANTADQVFLLTLEQNIIWYYLQEKILLHDLNIQILVIQNVFITNTCKENNAM